MELCVLVVAAIANAKNEQSNGDGLRDWEKERREIEAAAVKCAIYVSINFKTRSQ